MPSKRILILAIVLTAFVPVLSWAAGDPAPSGLFAALGTIPWWGWPVILFFFTILLGIVAVVAGIGGGVLFVPIVSALFPFHFDFVRGAGLLVALFGGLSAAPKLMKKGLASIRLALPFALVGSVGSLLGAMIGLALPDSLIELLLGIAILLIVILMAATRRSEIPEVREADPIASALRIHGVYYEPALGRDVEWRIHRTGAGLAAFVFIGFIAGLFGLGAGWANVPALNLLLGAPLKVSIASSFFILTVNSSAVWIYMNNGAMIPLIAVPAVTGMIIGSRIGAMILPRINPRAAKLVVTIILLVTGGRYILKGAGVFG